MNGSVNRSLLRLIVTAGALACTGVTTTAKSAWSFGVIGDTQWPCPSDPAGLNAGKVAASVISQIDAQFIAKGVKLVIQVGDLSEKQGVMSVRAAVAERLHDAGIAFFPIRGNHDASTPSSLENLRAYFPQTQGLGNTFGTSNFSSPTVGDGELVGLSYSFDYVEESGGARFLILDDWYTPNRKVIVPGLERYPYGYSVGEQQSWVDNRLDIATRISEHAFVFAHHNLIGENHADCLFSGFADANVEMQNAFFASLFNNGVRYYVSEHEHLAQRSIVRSPDGRSWLQDTISSSAGPKFIYPINPTWDGFRGQKERQTPIAQELNNTGFYIYTVDGPRVTVDYYSDVTGNYQSDLYWPNAGPNQTPGTQITPNFNFVKKDSWGYSLNGQEFLIRKGESYTGIVDEYAGTSAKILSGSNGATGTDFHGRHLSKLVTTGWSNAGDDDVRSEILTLWGMSELGTYQTDEFVLELSYRQGNTRHIGCAGFGIGTRDSAGNWTNAVNKNVGGTKQFVKGPWSPQCGLGAYGIDTSSKKVWAVLNYNGDFAAANEIEGDLGCP